MATKQPSRTARGFTLVELLTSVAVTVIVLAAVATTFLGVQRTYQIQAQVKTAIEGTRASSTYLTRELKLAGYGLDPQHAFDFDTAGLPGTTKSNFPEPSPPPGMPPFVTDDLAFRYRDPAYLRRGSLDPGGTTLTLQGASFGVPLPAGQRLLIACKGAQSYLVAATVGAVAATATSATISRGFAPFTGALGTDHACLKNVTGTDAAFVMLVRERRIRIVSLGGRPFLVVFHNLRAPDTAVNQDFDPIAADVEGFQVAYVMNRPIPGGAWTAQPWVDASSTPPNWVLGDRGSVASERIPNPAAIPPTYEFGYDVQERYNAHPANIRAVRVSVVARSTRPLAGTNDRARINGVRPMAVEDFTPGSTAPDGLYRTLISTTVRVPNMVSRAFFTPVIRENLGADPALNTWGS
jgi:type IV pilus assembly protein PilW